MSKVVTKEYLSDFKFISYIDNNTPGFKSIPDKCQLHSEDSDKPAIIYNDGSEEYFQNGFRHRENNKPAVIISNGDKHYFINGKLSRTDGPAIELTNGVKMYFINGIEFSEEEYYKVVNYYLAFIL